MSELLWTREETGLFSAETKALRLVVLQSPIPGQYRYQVLRLVAESSTYVCLSSGHQPKLKDAIDAAEGTATALDMMHW